MKEKLMEMIDAFRELDPPDDGRGWTEHLADHLLSEGVIAPSVEMSCKPNEEAKINIYPLINALAKCKGEGCISNCYLYNAAIKDVKMRSANCLNIANEIILTLRKENESLRAELETRPPRLVITRKQRKEKWK